MTTPLISQLIGFLGTALVVAAYLPQISHLIREHCSAGISEKAFVLWFIASLLFLAHAIMIKDVIFIVLQSINSFAQAIILLFVHRYERGVCAAHRGQ